DHGIQNIQELDWWQPLELENGCQLWGARSQHWTGRGLHGRNRSLWLSFVLETKGGPVYFAGDTGYADHFKQAHQRFGAMRLALLPIGAYQPRWLTAFQHMSPDEAVQAHLDLNAARSLGIHFGTFELADDGQFEPPQALARAVARNGIASDRFHAPEFGGGYDVKPLEESAGCSQ
ncbi:MAG: MBL fold metallo-hydrolase, partial [Panacagrimonas sp.]